MSMHQHQPSRPAGWYPDSTGVTRWWDGYQWTAHAQPAPAPAAVAAAPQKAVTYSRKRTSHTFHLVMSIITAGAWALLVWLPLTLWHKFGPRSRAVTRYR
mgnify:FL=1